MTLSITTCSIQAQSKSWVCSPPGSPAAGFAVFGRPHGPATDRLLRLLQAHHGWLLPAARGGRVGWVKLADDLELALRLNTDDMVSITLGHRDPDDVFMAELEALLTTVSILKDNAA